MPSRLGVDVDVGDLVGRVREGGAYFGVEELGGFPIMFRDRGREVEVLLRELGGVGVVYGPLGCGKSTFIRNFLRALGSVRDDVVAIYVNLEERALADSLRAYAIDLGGGVMSALTRAFNNDIVPILSGTEPGLLVGIGRFFYDLVNELRVGRELRDRYVVLAFDELDKRFRTMLGVGWDSQVSYGVIEGEVLAYAGAIEEHSGVIYDNVRGLTVLFGFSDRAAVDIVKRNGPKGGLSSFLLWYLPREEFVGLVNDVVGRVPMPRPVDPVVLWELLGGNVRELAVLVLRYGWNVNDWLSGTVIRRVRDVIIHEATARGVGVNSLLGKVADPDPLSAYLNLGGDYLLRMNVLIDIYGTTLSELPREPWVGSDYAYQLPAYYWVLRAMVNRSRIDVDPNDVINEVVRNAR